MSSVLRGGVVQHVAPFSVQEIETKLLSTAEEMLRNGSPVTWATLTRAVAEKLSLSPEETDIEMIAYHRMKRDTDDLLTEEVGHDGLFVTVDVNGFHDPKLRITEKGIKFLSELRRGGKVF